MRQVNLEVNGQPISDPVTIFSQSQASGFSGWQNITITKTIDNVCHVVAVAVDSYNNAQDLLLSNEKVQVQIGNDLVTTCRFEQVNATVKHNEKTFNARGRSITGDLVDCSATAPFEFSNISLVTLANIICKPFGITASLAGGSNKKINKVTINPGEGVFEVLAKYAQLQGDLWKTNEQGNLELVNPKASGASIKIIEQQHIKSLSVNASHNEIFTEYNVLGEESSSFKLKDNRLVGRHRPKVILVNETISAQEAQTRANWERAKNIAKEFSLNCSLQGWRNPAGALWEPGQIVRVVSSELGLQLDMLLRSVTFTKNIDSGTNSTLDFILPGGLSKAPPAKEKESGSSLIERIRAARARGL